MIWLIRSPEVMQTTLEFLPLSDVASVAEVHHLGLACIRRLLLGKSADQWIYNTLVQSHELSSFCIPKIGKIFKLPLPPRFDFRAWVLKGGHRLPIEEMFEKALAAQDPAVARFYAREIPFDALCVALQDSLRMGHHEMTQALLHDLKPRFLALGTSAEKKKLWIDQLGNLLIEAFKKGEKQTLHTLLALPFNPEERSLLLLIAVKAAAIADRKELVEHLATLNSSDNAHAFAAQVWLGTPELSENPCPLLPSSWVDTLGFVMATLGNHPSLQELFASPGNQEGCLTALSNAAALGNEGQVAKLLSLIDPQESSSEALSRAAEIGHLNITMRLLPFAKGSLRKPLERAIKCHQPPIVHLLLSREKKENLTAALPELIRLAARQKNLDILQPLLPLSERGEALQCIAQAGYEAGVESLLAQAKTCDVQQALKTAALAGHLVVTERLLQEEFRRGSPSLCPPQYHHLFLWAVHTAAKDLTEAILSNRVSIIPLALARAAAACETKLMTHLVRSSEATSELLNSPLLIATESGCPFIADQLLHARFPIDRKTRREALRLAITRGEKEICQLLLATDLDDSDVQAALESACERLCSPEVTALLLQDGKRLSLTTWTSALVKAIRRPHPDLLPVLLSAGVRHAYTADWKGVGVAWAQAVVLTPPEQWIASLEPLSSDHLQDLLGWASHAGLPQAVPLLLQNGKITPQGLDKALLLAVSRPNGNERVIRQLLHERVSRSGIQAALNHISPGVWERSTWNLLSQTLYSKNGGL